MPLIRFRPDYDRGRNTGSKEKIFLEQYDWLLQSALSLTRGQKERAEDLVHDVFVQFQIKLKNLEEVDDLRAYLYGMLRNLYLSQLRSASRHPIQQLSILDHDSIFMGLRAHDFSDQLHAITLLTRACEFVSHRKETTLTASVFILRYFHCYYPDEIATLLATQRETVDKWLFRGRAEAKAFLAEPYSIPKNGGTIEKAGGSQVFLAQLRGMIFASCLPPCPATASTNKALEFSFGTKELAHLVSCPACLDGRSKQLGLPGIAERVFDESHLRDDRGEPPMGGSGMGTPPTPKKSRMNKLRKGYARTRELLSHHPTELSIALDGHIRTSHVISSSVSLLSLTVDAKERVEFVEILSEQGVRFLILDRADLETTALLRYDIALSDGRVLEVEIVPDVPGPCIQVSYRDPGLNHLSTALAESTPPELFGSRERLTLWAALRTWFSGLPGHLRVFGMLGASVCMVAALSLSLWKRPQTRPPFGQILHMVSQKEQSLSANAAAHSVFSYEEEDAAGHLQHTGEVESWRQAMPRRLALRLYDAHHALVGGLAQDLRGSAEYGNTADDRGQTEPSPAWQDVPSAEHFASLLSPGASPQITEAGDQYRIVIHSPRSRPELVEAVLIVDRHAMRAVEADYDIRNAEGVHRVRLREVSYEVRSANEFNQGVFDVGRDFDRTSRRPRGAPETFDDSKPNTAALELKVLTDLMQAGARAGEQLDVHRDRQSGMVEVRGVVDTPERKTDLLEAIAPLADDPHLKVSLRSTDELPQTSPVRKSRHSRMQPAAPLNIDNLPDTFEPASTVIPEDAAIRAYLKTKGLTGKELDDAVHSFASKACAQSLQAQQHAYRLAELAAEFSPSDLAQLDAGARLQWLVLINNYSEALNGDLKVLRAHLEPIVGTAFAESTTPLTPSAPLTPFSDPVELAAASRNILSQTARLNQQVQSAFSIAAVARNSQPDLQPAGNGALPEMMNLLNAAESMASNVSATAQHLKLFATNAK